MSVDLELRKAAALINAGRLEAARSILSDYLKEFPESDLAWLLMSYVLDDPRKQQASATRAFRLNPENQQAKARVEQLLEFQAPSSPEVTSDDFSSDFERYVPDHEPLTYLQESSSRPLSIEERLAFVSLEAESFEENNSREYPEDSFLIDGDPSIARSPGRKSPRKLNVRKLLGGVLSVLLLGSLIFVGAKFVSGGFLSEADAQATASMETEIAWATQEIKARLPATWTPTITPTPMPTSSATPTPLPTGTATMIPPNPTVKVELDVLQQEVADLRQLPILNEVETFMIHRSKVRTILKEYYFSLEGSRQEILDNGRVLLALGLIEPTYDLETNILNSLVDGVGGFYLHEIQQIYVIGTQFSGVEKFIYSHEFGHALVDQNYDLSRMSVYPRCLGNEDRCKAIQALIEGDATLLMLQWFDQGATNSEYDEIARYHPPTRVIPEQSPPPFALRNSEFPYNEGKAFVEELYARGEWTGVNQAYSRLPESTEQILHPAKYFAAEQPIQVPEVGLESVLGEDWEQIKSNTLGEWFTYLILGFGANPRAQLNEGDAVRAAEGWGGDHYQVYYNAKTEQILLVVHWKWDQSSDASEFAVGMRFYLKGRFSLGEMVEIDRECWNGNDQFTCLYNDSQQSLWIVAPSMELVDAVEELYPDF